jgi:hypothetical protein
MLLGLQTFSLAVRAGTDPGFARTAPSHPAGQQYVRLISSERLTPMNELRAAHGSWILGLLTYLLPLLLFPLFPHLGFLPKPVFTWFPVLTPLAGFTLGVVGLSGRHKYGRRAVIPASIGLLINGLALGAMAAALVGKLLS